MGFNFSEEEITNMYEIYEKALETIQEQTQNVVEQITKKAQELKYKVVNDMSINAVNYYNETLRDAEMKAFTEWQNGDASFTNFMELMSAGENAKNRCKTLELKIEEGIASWRRLDDSQLSGMEDANATCSPKDMEEIQQIINQYITKLENEKSQCISRISARKDENAIYVSIEPVVLQSFAIVIEGFQTGISASYGELGQEIGNRENKARALGESVLQSTSSRVQSYTSSGASALKATVKQIME